MSLSLILHLVRLKEASNSLLRLILITGDAVRPSTVRVLSRQQPPPRGSAGGGGGLGRAVDRLWLRSAVAHRRRRRLIDGQVLKESVRKGDLFGCQCQTIYNRIQSPYAAQRWLGIYTGPDRTPVAHSQTIGCLRNSARHRSYVDCV